MILTSARCKVEVENNALSIWFQYPYRMHIQGKDLKGTIEKRLTVKLKKNGEFYERSIKRIPDDCRLDYIFTARSVWEKRGKIASDSFSCDGITGDVI